MSILFLLLFGAIFLLVVTVFIVILVKNLKQQRVNNNSPRLTVEATVVSRRQNVSHHNTANAGDITGAHGYTTTSSTTYYATFQVESGDRMELAIPGSQYGMLAEGDRGRLSFQGTRFLNFERS
jgi:hypothetical protein